MIFSLPEFSRNDITHYYLRFSSYLKYYGYAFNINFCRCIYSAVQLQEVDIRAISQYKQNYSKKYSTSNFQYCNTKKLGDGSLKYDDAFDSDRLAFTNKSKKNNRSNSSNSVLSVRGTANSKAASSSKVNSSSFNDDLNNASNLRVKPRVKSNVSLPTVGNMNNVETKSDDYDDNANDSYQNALQFLIEYVFKYVLILFHNLFS